MNEQGASSEHSDPQASPGRPQHGSRLEAAQAAVGPLLEFIGASPSPFHAAANAADLLASRGIELVNIDDGTGAAPKRGVSGGPEAMGAPTAGRPQALMCRRGGTLLAATLPTDGVNPDRLRFAIVGAHTDSPNLRIRPNPDTHRVGYRQLAVEPYGGLLLNSWLDRDLGFSGSLQLRSGESLLVCVNRPLLRVPQLAIHLDREVNKGLTLDPQQHLQPVWGLGDDSEGGLREFLAAEAGVDSADISGWELMAHDVNPPTLAGVDGEFYATGRIDNLTSCWAATEALASVLAGGETDGGGDAGEATAAATAATPAETVRVLALFDHEEVGSTTSVGAAGALLAQFMERIAQRAGADRGQFLAALGRSICASVDGAHAVHPNYVDRHEPLHQPKLNGGPVVKHNVNARYATSAASAAAFQRACEAASVPLQHYSHHASLPCGSTIGPLTAAGLAVDTVDVGAPQLAMHSAREMAGSADPAMLRDALLEFFAR